MEQFNLNESQRENTREGENLDLKKVGIVDGAKTRVDELVERAIREGRLTFTLTDENGLHMRPADQLVRATNRSQCRVELVRAEDALSAPTQGNSILSIVLLTLNCKEAVTVSAVEGDLKAFWTDLIGFDFWQVRE